MSRVCVVAAGGTGGHMFPAEALARELAARGWRIVLATDRRGQAYAGDFPAEERLALDAATGHGPAGLVMAGGAIIKGVGQARAAFRRLDPAVVVGFGGYPSAPAAIAALSQRRPVLVHEQNAVLGRTNRWLAPYVAGVATAFPDLRGGPQGMGARIRLVGNPVRPAIAALADRAYAPPAPNAPIEVLITGGSQGARILAEAVPAALAMLPEALRRRLRVAQQSRLDTADAARAAYAAAGIEAEVRPFFADMAERLGRAHLVVARAGASTCSELALAGRPSILVPLKIAMDDHQTHNAAALTRAGGAEVVAEDDARPETLAARLRALLSDPDRLSLMATGARTTALPEATARLADWAEAAARPAR